MGTSVAAPAAENSAVDALAVDAAAVDALAFSAGSSEDPPIRSTTRCAISRSMVADALRTSEPSASRWSSTSRLVAPSSRARAWTRILSGSSVAGDDAFASIGDPLSVTYSPCTPGRVEDQRGHSGAQRYAVVGRAGCRRRPRGWSFGALQPDRETSQTCGARLVVSAVHGPRRRGGSPSISVEVRRGEGLLANAVKLAGRGR